MKKNNRMAKAKMKKKRAEKKRAVKRAAEAGELERLMNLALCGIQAGF